MSDPIFHSADDFGVCRSLILSLARLMADRAVHESMHRWSVLRAAEGERVAPLGNCLHWQATSKAEATIRRQAFMLLRQAWRYVCEAAPAEAADLRHLADHAKVGEIIEQVLQPRVRERRGMGAGYMLKEAEKAVEPLLSDLRKAESVSRKAENPRAGGRQAENPASPSGQGRTKQEQIHAFLLQAMQSGRTFKSQREGRAALEKETGLRVSSETFSQAVKSAPAGLAEVVKPKTRKESSVRARRLSVVDIDKTASGGEADPLEAAVAAEHDEAVDRVSRIVLEYREASGGARKRELLESVFERMPRLRSQSDLLQEILGGSQPAEQAAATILLLLDDADR